LFEINQVVSPDTIMHNIKVELKQKIKTSGIYYTLNGRAPNIASKMYTEPIYFQEDCKVRAASFGPDYKIQGKSEQDYHLSKSTGKRINLTPPPSEYYNNGGSFTLVDGILGKIPWNGKEWLGFSGTNIQAVIDLDSTQEIKSVLVDLLRDENSWIYLPGSIEVLISDNGSDFTSVAKSDSANLKKQGRLVYFQLQEISTRFVKVLVTNPGKIPLGKPGEGHNSWVFIDEILID
jgi:hexosaminidase